MAKIHEEVVVIKLSKLVKDDVSTSGLLVNDDILSALEQVAQELVGDSVVVEVMKA
jgi:hypothetical protein